MIYTVTFNPSIDYIVSVDDFKYGTVNRTSSEIVYPGGKGINVSAVLENLGYKNTAMGFLAGFTGNEIQRLLNEKGIATDFIYAKKGMSRINVKLCFDEETEINGQGPLISNEEIEGLYKRFDKIKDGDILVLAGSIPNTLPKTLYRDIMLYLKEKNISIIVDAAGELLLNVLDYKPFLIKPNKHELEEICGVQLDTKDKLCIYAKDLQKKGAKNVLVSMAGDGAVLAAEDESIYTAEAPKGNVINSVGAGDSMVAGFIAGYVESGSYEKAFKMGLCAGSASAFSEKIAEKEDIYSLFDKIKIKKINY